MFGIQGTITPSSVKVAVKLSTPAKPRKIGAFQLLEHLSRLLKLLRVEFPKRTEIKRPEEKEKCLLQRVRIYLISSQSHYLVVAGYVHPFPPAKTRKDISFFPH